MAKASVGRKKSLTASRGKARRTGGHAKGVEPSGPARAVPQVWAVGGGKGGVGKSVVSANLAVSLASRGLRTAVVDFDLGGANLHTVLGVQRTDRSLSDFFGGRVKELSELLLPTAVPNLSVVSGARGGVDVANPRFAEKQRLLRHLRRLDVAHVIVDLGAGSTFNVLDPFVTADKRIMVVAPEPTSIENAYHFLKAAFFRAMRAVAKTDGARPILEACLETAREKQFSPRELLEEVECRDSELGERLKLRSAQFAPSLIVNQADTVAHRRIGFEMSIAARQYLGTPLGFVGSLPLDAAVPVAIAKQTPIVQLLPGGEFAISLERALRRIQNDTCVDESAAPPDWSVRSEHPNVSTHGLAPKVVPAPKLKGAKRRNPVPAALPALPLPDLDLDHPGETLRRCREALGLGIPQMCARTQIRHLGRLESQVVETLPPIPYLRAQVRAYAVALGLDAGDAESLALRYVEIVAGEAPKPSLGERARQAIRMAVLPLRKAS